MMNKKGDCTTGALIILLIILLTVGIVGLHYSSKASDLNCKELGFEEYEYREPYEFCKDSEGNLHYIERVCKNKFLDTNCEAREISIGNVRVIER